MVALSGLAVSARGKKTFLGDVIQNCQLGSMKLGGDNIEVQWLCLVRAPHCDAMGQPVTQDGLGRGVRAAVKHFQGGKSDVRRLRTVLCPA